MPAQAAEKAKQPASKRVKRGSGGERQRQDAVMAVAGGGAEEVPTSPEKAARQFRHSPEFLTGTTLHDYQLEVRPCCPPPEHLFFYYSHFQVFGKSSIFALEGFQVSVHKGHFTFSSSAHSVSLEPAQKLRLDLNTAIFVLDPASVYSDNDGSVRKLVELG